MPSSRSAAAAAAAGSSSRSRGGAGAGAAAIKTEKIAVSNGNTTRKLKRTNADEFHAAGTSNKTITDRRIKTTELNSNIERSEELSPAEKALAKEAVKFLLNVDPKTAKSQLDGLFKEALSSAKQANNKDKRQVALAAVQMLTRFIESKEDKKAGVDIDISKENAQAYQKAFLVALHEVIVAKYPEAREVITFVDAMADDPKTFFQDPKNTAAVLEFAEKEIAKVAINKKGEAVQPMTEEERNALKDLMRAIAPLMPNNGKFFKMIGLPSIPVGTLVSMIIGFAIDNAAQAAVIAGLCVILVGVVVGLIIDVVRQNQKKEADIEAAAAQMA